MGGGRGGVLSNSHLLVAACVTYPQAAGGDNSTQEYHPSDPVLPGTPKALSTAGSPRGHVTCGLGDASKWSMYWMTF